MRPLIFIPPSEANTPAQYDQHAEEVTRIRNAFDRYLDRYPVKTARTKTGLMGPVGKILNEVRSGRWDAESLTGYAMNVHLMSLRTNYMDPVARAALSEGIAALCALMKDLGPSAQDRLLDRIDYGLYWLRRRKGMEYLEQVRSEYSTYLQQQYGTTDAVNQAWARPKKSALKSFDQVYFPSKKSKHYQDTTDAERATINGFWEQRGETPAEPLTEEGEEE